MTPDSEICVFLRQRVLFEIIFEIGKSTKTKVSIFIKELYFTSRLF